jgi:hypothetical protein
MENWQLIILQILNNGVYQDWHKNNNVAVQNTNQLDIYEKFCNTP